MQVEQRDGILFVKSSLTDSHLRIERQDGDIVCIGIASSDNSGVMHIESASIPLEDIRGLTVQPRASFRSLTSAERLALSGGCDG